MAGGMDLGTGGRSRRKPLDTTINLVPFIDLMAVTISFLIMTAVWTQVARLQVASAAGASSEQTVTPGLQVEVAIDPNGLTLSVEHAALIHLPRTERGQDLAGLREQLHALRNAHPDQTQVTVRCADHIAYDDLVRTIDTCVGEGLTSVSVAGE